MCWFRSAFVSKDFLHDYTGVGSDTLLERSSVKLVIFGQIHGGPGSKTHRPHLSSFLPNRPSDGRTLHLSLGVDDDTRVVLKVQVDAVCAPPGLGLPDDDGGHDLLAQLWFPLLDGRHHHVADTAGGQTVQTCAEALDGDDVQVSRTGVVGAVHDGSAVCGQVMLVSGFFFLVEIRHGLVTSGKTYTGRPRVMRSLVPLTAACLWDVSVCGSRHKESTSSPGFGQRRAKMGSSETATEKRRERPRHGVHCRLVGVVCRLDSLRIESVKRHRSNFRVSDPVEYCCMRVAGSPWPIGCRSRKFIQI